MSDKYNVPESQTGFPMTGTSLHFTWIWSTGPVFLFRHSGWIVWISCSEITLMHWKEMGFQLLLSTDNLPPWRLERFGGTKGIKSRYRTEWPLLQAATDEDQEGKATLTCKQQLLLMWLAWLLLWKKHQRILFLVDIVHFTPHVFCQSQPGGRHTRL